MMLATKSLPPGAGSLSPQGRGWGEGFGAGGSTLPKRNAEPFTRPDGSTSPLRGEMTFGPTP